MLPSLNDAPKENANPALVASTEQERHRWLEDRQRTLWRDHPQLMALGGRGPEPALESLHLPTTLQPRQQRTMIDRVIHQALWDSTRPTPSGEGGKAVSLLQNTVGIVITSPGSVEPGSASFREPFFYPRHSTTDIASTATATTSLKTTTTIKTLSPSRQHHHPSQKEPITAEEIFHLIRNIQDPEHPHTLEELAVVSREQIEIELSTEHGRLSHHHNNNINDDEDNRHHNHQNPTLIQVRFTPTIPHCSMATLIGLCLTIKLQRSLPPPLFRIQVKIEPGTHNAEHVVNKQLADKERVCAAVENQHLASVVNRCIAGVQ